MGPQHHRPQSVAAQPEQVSGALDTAHGARQDFGVWLTSRDLIEYIPCPTLNAVYCWLKRHGFDTRNGRVRVRRALVDRVLNRTRKRRVMAPASLANLRGASVRLDSTVNSSAAQ